jgi:hypothetical protein
MISRMKPLAVLIAAALLLAACSSPAPLTARQLAGKIPGCSGTYASTPAVLEEQDVTCTLPDGAPVTIGTFAASRDETAWISDGGSPASPDPAYAGCCVQGPGCRDRRVQQLPRADGPRPDAGGQGARRAGSRRLEPHSAAPVRAAHWQSASRSRVTTSAIGGPA